MREWLNAPVTLLSAIRTILLSVLLVPGSACIAVLAARSPVQLGPSVTLRKLVTTGPQKEAIPTVYIEEILGLAADVPQTIEDFDCEAAEASLLATGVIQEASVSTFEDAVYVDYTVREPLALLHEWQNRALDKDGFVFPVKPYLTPKSLPVVYVGASRDVCPEKLEGPEWLLAKRILDFCTNHSDARLQAAQYIDTSSAYSPSLGKRQIVLTLLEPEHASIPSSLWMLRLSTRNWEEECNRYLALRSTMGQSPDESLKVLDLRVPKLGYLLKQSVKI